MLLYYYLNILATSDPFAAEIVFLSINIIVSSDY